jgi:hypothetical protein
MRDMRRSMIETSLTDAMKSAAGARERAELASTPIEYDVEVVDCR